MTGTLSMLVTGSTDPRVTRMPTTRSVSLRGRAGPFVALAPGGPPFGMAPRASGCGQHRTPGDGDQEGEHGPALPSGPQLVRDEPPDSAHAPTLRSAATIAQGAHPPPRGGAGTTKPGRACMTGH